KLKVILYLETRQYEQSGLAALLLQKAAQGEFRISYLETSEHSAHIGGAQICLEGADLKDIVALLAVALENDKSPQGIKAAHEFQLSENLAHIPEIRDMVQIYKDINAPSI